MLPTHAIPMQFYLPRRDTDTNLWKTEKFKIPMTGNRMPFKNLAIILWILGLTQVVWGYFPPDDPAELTRTWEQAELIFFIDGEPLEGPLNDQRIMRKLASLPSGAKYPALLYLHGCYGIDRDQSVEFWRQLARAGYVVIRPDSFARRNRPEQCGKQVPWVYEARLSEVYYALEQMRTLPWIDVNNMVLYGHSEGGVAASRYAGLAFDGVVISAASCQKFAIRVPSLAVGSVDDEQLNGEFCNLAQDQLLLPGDNHQILSDPVARERIRAFIEGVTGFRTGYGMGLP